LVGGPGLTRWAEGTTAVLAIENPILPTDGAMSQVEIRHAEKDLVRQSMLCTPRPWRGPDASHSPGAATATPHL
jgi:hypothetical protein